MIHFQDYGWHYAHAAAPSLQDITLTLDPGECVLLAGASGSGKSTLGLALAGLLIGRYPGRVSGILTLDGQDVTQASPLVLADTVALVQQNPEKNFATQYVEQELAFTLENRCMGPESMRREVDRILRQFKIEDLRHRRLGDLSEGQKQRVAIAAACITDPRILFLDEPSSSLDPDGLQDLVALLHELRQKRDRILIIAEHRTGLHAPLQPRMLRLEEGRLIGDQAWVAPATEYEPRSPRPYNGDTRLTVSNLNVERDGTSVLNDISFSLMAGEVTALMGPNGSGKSTLLLTLLGLIPARSGRMSLNGHKVTPQATYDLASRTGLVFQNPDHQLFTDSVWEEALFAARNYGKSGSAFEQAESRLVGAHLHDYKHVHPLCLSFGQKRRLNVISAITHDIRVLFLDEPFGGQDPDHIDWLLETLDHLAKNAITVMMVTHDPDLVAVSCDRLLFLEHGRLRVDASPEQAWPDLLGRGYPTYAPRTWRSDHA